MNRQRRRQCEPQVPLSWARYFPPGEYDPSDRRALLIGEMLAVFSGEHGWRMLQHGARQHLEGYAVMLDYTLLCSVAKSADLEAAIDMQPAEGLACLSACLFELLFVGPDAKGPLLFGEGAPPGHVATRLFNHPASSASIRDLKSSQIGKLVTIKGTVVRVSSIKPLVTAMDFVCAKCEQSTRCTFVDGVFDPPARCGTEGCRGRSFAPDHGSAAAVDWQKVRVQEVTAGPGPGLGANPPGAPAPSAGGAPSDGQVPRSVEVELRSDLVDSCSAGDAVTVVAVVKAMSTQGRGGRGADGGRAQSALFLLYLDAVSVISERRSAGLGGAAPKPQAPPSNAASNQRPFSLRDLQFIVKFSQEVEGDQFRHLVRALCPSIFGHELVKAGLLLALAGGVRKHAADSSKIAIRGDIHVLLVGDPGQGKSQLLMAATAATPRGIYVGANTCTTAGLTVSVVRDAMTGDYAFEAGAMVLADQGVCCVDEFDKMTGDPKALLVAMEQQEVSVAKAGLVANLPARTTVLAAANPSGGHYNRGKTVKENLKMSGALLSRFDLVFILMDRPDERLDARLSEHVMALHSGAHASEQMLLEYPAEQQPQLLTAADSQGNPQRLTLLQRLKACSPDDGPPLPVPLLKKYIAYARKYVHPKVGPEANAVLKSFYLELRRGANPNDGTPITARQLESLVRLAEARARLELREEVTRNDAEDVVELMKEALHDKFADEFGLMDLRSSAPGAGKSRQAEAKRFLTALRRISQCKGEALFTTAELYSAADELELNVPDMGDFIEHLNEQGELLKKGSGVFKLSSGGASQGPEGFSGMRKRRR